MTWNDLADIRILIIALMTISITIRSNNVLNAQSVKKSQKISQN